MAAPRASPMKEMSAPFTKPKNKMLAAVTNTLGTKPSTATKMLMQMLINTDSFGYSLKSSNSCSCKINFSRED